MKNIMHNQLKRNIIFVAFFLFLSSSVSGQFKSRIGLVVDSVFYYDGNLTVKYSINNAKAQDKIRVWMDVITSGKDTLREAKSWSGDINKVLDGGGKKTAVWNIFQDKLELLDSLQFRVSATVENRFHLDDPLVLSTIYPGWGDYKIRKKKPYWIYGAIGWSLVGASVGTYISAKTNYDSYLADRTIAGRNSYHSKAIMNRNLSYTFLGTAAVVWAIDYFGIIRRKREIKRKWKDNPPIYETPEVPSFTIVRAWSKKLFVNTRLTDLVVENINDNIKYVDKDGNKCLDAFEKAYVVFDITNKGPAKAYNFYARLETSDQSNHVIFPDSVPLGIIHIGDTKRIRLPIIAKKDIEDGSINVDVKIRAKYNRPVDPFRLKINTCSFKYKANITSADLKSDIDRNIPLLGRSSKKRFALVIGNEGYANAQTQLSQSFNVPYARHDAIIFKKYLEKVFGMPSANVVLLLDATRKDMYEALNKITDRISKLPRREQPEFVLYYAGQGLSDTASKAPYLMPVDVNPDSLSQAMSLEEMYEIVSNGEAVQNVVILDASFNNGGRKMGLRGPYIEKMNHRQELIYGFTVVFNAAQEKYSSNSYDAQNHGLLTYCFLKEIQKNKGNISYYDLYKKLIEIVPVMATSINKEQKPSHAVSVAVERTWQRWKVR